MKTHFLIQFPFLRQPPVSPSPPIARGSTSTVQPTTANNTISNTTPTPMHPDDLPKFLKQEWNAPPSRWFYSYFTAFNACFDDMDYNLLSK